MRDRIYGGHRQSALTKPSRLLASCSAIGMLETRARVRILNDQVSINASVTARGVLEA